MACLTATGAFRYVRRDVAPRDQDEYREYIFVLQQGWQDDEGKTVWCDVPVVDEGTGERLPTSALFFGQSC